MGKRIRYPKKQMKKEVEEIKKETMQEEPKEQEQKMHFVLDVHDSNLSDFINFGH